jgi:cytidine deaminase
MREANSMISDEQRTQLVNAAIDARERAYAPYSGYRVGAALLTDDSTIVTGCNVENASYGATICAERVALTRAVAEGRIGFVAMAVATADGGSPCGICRQVMVELGPEMAVFISDTAGNFRSTTVQTLLPDSFDGSGLISEVRPLPKAALHSAGK